MTRLRETPEQARITLFKAAVAKYLTLRGLSKESLTTVMCMSRSSLWEKLNNPDNFRIGELRQLYTVLEFDEADRQILI